MKICYFILLKEVKESIQYGESSSLICPNPPPAYGSASSHVDNQRVKSLEVNAHGKEVRHIMTSEELLPTEVLNSDTSPGPPTPP